MATPVNVIATLQERGVLLNPLPDGGLEVLGASRLTADEKATLKAHKAVLIDYLNRQAMSAPQAAILEFDADMSRAEADSDNAALMPFDQEHLDANKAGYAVHVWSGVLGEWLWWVRDETVKTKLAEKKGIDRGLIYTLGELAVVIDAAPDDLRNLHAIKKQFDGVIHHADDKSRA